MSESPATRTTFRLLSLGELFALKVPKLNHIVDGILPRGEFGMLSAREKAGKGLIAIDLLASVTNEEPFLDRAVTPCNAAYFAAEEHINTVRDRIAVRFGDNREPPFQVAMLNTILEDGGEAERLNIAEALDLQKLADTIKANDLGLVGLDVLRELHNLPENESDFMAPLLKPVRQITRETGCTIFITHHHGYANRARGSTSIKAAFDFEWSFVRTDDAESEEPPVGRLVVEGRMPKTVLRIKFGDGGRWHLAAAPPETPPSGIREHILKWLTHGQNWQTAEELESVLIEPRYKRKTILNALTVMCSEQPPSITWRRRAGKGGPKEYHCCQPPIADSYDDYELSQHSPPLGMNGKESSTQTTAEELAARWRE